MIDFSVPSFLFLRDLDNDGDIDIVSASKTSSEMVITLNEGNGKFMEPKIISTNNIHNLLSIQLSDIDNDLDIDIHFLSADDVVQR